MAGIQESIDAELSAKTLDGLLSQSRLLLNPAPGKAIEVKHKRSEKIFSVWEASRARALLKEHKTSLVQASHLRHG